MDVQALRDDAAAGKLSVDRLVDLLAMQQQQINQQRRRIQELEARIEAKKNPTERLDQSYSEKAEQNRKGSARKRKPKPLRRGRISTADKIKLAQRTEQVYQLAKAWESEFDALCTLLANAAVVHTDEPSWSINSVWAFLSDKLTVLFYGVHKDGETLAQILNKETFAGVIVSDNAPVYQDFSKAQKCWAHLLRKAIIRLMWCEELFVFVTEPSVVGNNNAAERQLRGDALARKTDRTSKTPQGAKRRSIIASVMQSIGKQLENFTLESVIAEAQRWLREGSSCFHREVESRGLSPPTHDQLGDDPSPSLLDRLVLHADS